MKNKPIKTSSRLWNTGLLVFLVLFWVLSGCNQGNEHKNHNQESSDFYYTCSMDPQVVEYKPGKCPICKMELTKVKKNKSKTTAELQLSDQQIKLGNIKIDTLKRQNFKEGLILNATLNVNQDQTTSYSSRVMGRIEKLYHKSLGDYVQKGDPLYDLYSEELNVAKQEYLLAFEKKKVFNNESIIDIDKVIQSAKNKLLLWGLSEHQINELIKTPKISPKTTFYSTSSGYITTLDVIEGDYVMEGGLVVKLADLSTLWVEAQVFSSQFNELDEQALITVKIPNFETIKINSNIEFVNPEINPKTRISLIRVSISNLNNQLKPGMLAYILLEKPQKNTLLLPPDAVIRDTKGSTVWLKSGINLFRSIMVQTGLENDSQIEIIKGLKEGDVVVTAGAYLLNSEYVFKKGANPMSAHNH